MSDINIWFSTTKLLFLVFSALKKAPLDHKQSSSNWRLIFLCFDEESLFQMARWISTKVCYILLVHWFNVLFSYVYRESSIQSWRMWALYVVYLYMNISNTVIPKLYEQTQQEIVYKLSNTTDHIFNQDWHFWNIWMIEIKSFKGWKVLHVPATLQVLPNKWKACWHWQCSHPALPKT